MTNLLTQLKITLQPDLPSTVRDDELIQRFVECNDGEAFTEIVRRHGPMVLGVCRRVLHHWQDAEDAFQAVFLVLAQKAASVSSAKHLSSWLYTVACRSAMRARTHLTARQRQETTLDQHQLTDESASPETREWQTLLDEELERLPEKYRMPILLCELQGYTRSETAQRLGCPEGTVAGRLHRAKQMLVRRLSQRGVTFSLATLTSTFAGTSAQAVLPLRLLATTVRIATFSNLGEVGTGVVPPTISYLTEGVIDTMSTSLTKMMTALCVVVLAIGSLYWGTSLALSQDAPGASTCGDSPSEPTRKRVEPIHPRLVFEKPVQQELRLSAGQIQKLKQAWESGKADVKDEVKRNDAIEKEMAALRKKLNTLQKEKNVLHEKITASQESTTREAIFEHLSSRAVRRLQQLSLRRIGLRQLLQDPRLSAKLNINDEQLKKLQDVQAANFEFTLGFTGGGGMEGMSGGMGTLEYGFGGLGQNFSLFSSQHSEDALLKILTPQQRTLWKQMVGNPYPSNASKKK